MRARFTTTETKAVALSEEQLQALGSDGYTGGWYVREAVLAHDQVDSDYERFSPTVLEDFARTLPGKGLLIGHKRDGLPEGLWVSAEVRDAGARQELRAVFAIPEIDSTQTTREKLQAGIARFVSIGFKAADLVDDDGRSMLTGDSADWPGRRRQDGTRAVGTWIAPAEAQEGSLVWLGAQPGAELKSADGEPSYVKDAGDDGLVLDWPQLAVEAVRCAGARGSAGKSAEDRARAWLGICAAYRALGKAVPEWTPGEKFAWEQFREDELNHWHYDQAVSEAKNVNRTIDSRIAGSFRHLSEVGACLPADAKAELRRAKASIESLLGESEPQQEQAPAAEPERTPSAHETLIADILAAHVPTDKRSAVFDIAGLVSPATGETATNGRDACEC